MEGEPHALASDYDRRNVTGSGPYEVEVAARLGEVRLPALCARCGGAPTRSLTVQKMFRRVGRRTGNEYRFERLPVPVCEACALLHEAERRPPDPALLRALRNRWLLSTIPYWIPIGIIVFMLVQLGPAALGAFAGGERVDQLVWLGVLLFFTVALLAFLRSILAARRNLIAGYGGDPNDQHVEIVRGPLGITCVLPGPPTATLAAVNFTDEDFELLAKNRRVYTFTNLDVATAFAAANADLVWEPNSPRAIRSRWAANALFVVLAVVGVALWLRELLGF